ncbi:MAG: histidinol dehydrogenase [Porticoccaceae bacterium]|jgi:histidinol dehydrogenase
MSKPLIKRLSTSDGDFIPTLDKLVAWNTVSDATIESRVAEIIQQVRSKGDQALVEYSNQFDHRTLKSAEDFYVSTEALQQALESIDTETREALEAAAARITEYHKHQSHESWQYEESDGSMLGQRVTPLDRVGLYVPGGKASYPSSVLMSCIPAKIAGVEEIIMAVPAPEDELNPIVLAAAAIAGVNKVFTIGGAQAVAAMAYGTETIPQVDKIVGPGNIYVATAKRMVFGAVGLDMVAGPTEILIICDGKTDPDWIAMDLFSQAEHDENAQAILLSWDKKHLDAVYQSIARLLPEMERKEIIAESLANRGALIEVADQKEAIMLSNRIAPEHLELSVEDPELWLSELRHAGAIFMGRYTAEALGDYSAGPSHVLPTSATARFSSPLSVYDFQKRTSLIYCSPEGASELGKIASVLGRGEALTAHARSAEYRIKK